MCKHILFNNFQDTDIDVLKSFISSTYDRDGYGAIIRTKENKIEMIKSLDQSHFYIDVMRALPKIKDLVIHHRTSTNGDGIDYAHPFEYEKNYLTHNGVVSVPGKHDTKTKNDSEALLHYLIKSDYDTKKISGYFSCFILNKYGTTVLVDDVAPIYTDRRIFSSHQLDKSWDKIEKTKIWLVDGVITQVNAIELTKTDYGMTHYSSSIGKGTSYDYGCDYKGYSYSNVDSFLYSLHDSELRDLENCTSYREIRLAIKNIASAQGLQLTKKEISELCDSFLVGDRVGNY